MELDWTTERVGGVTLVHVWVENQRTVDRFVRLRNRLDGPVLPPRREREPEAGWDREGLSAVVPAGETIARGYACPAPDADPPVAITDVGPPAELPDIGATVTGVIRRLGDPRPPRSVLGMAGRTAASPETADSPSEQTATTERERVADGIAETAAGTDHLEEYPHAELPSELAAMLTPYRERVETVEALGVASVPEAATVLDASGGLAGIEETRDQLDEDARALRALAVEATALAARAEAATPPLDAIRRLS